MNIDANSIVGDIVKANFKTAQVFEKHKIDFCCGGGVSIKDACRISGSDISVLIPKLETLIQINEPDSNYINGLELDELCDYIEKRYHTYVNDNLLFLQQKLQKLCDVHGKNHTELFGIKELFDGAAANLIAHMKKEELLLFPYIRKMIKHKKEGLNTDYEFGGVFKPIRQMEEEHQVEGERFDKISELTHNYICPADGCNTYQVTFKTLHDFEKNLHHHIHLENNILFKAAVILETELIN